MTIKSPAHQMNNPQHHTMLKNLVRVLVPNGFTLGVVTLTNLEAVLKVGLLGASIVYTTLCAIHMWQRIRKP